jgi:peptidoglycan/LPS O-acetylase OafA/YrhL
MARENQGYIFSLDGWRALAIIAVLADHIVGYEFHGRRGLFVLTRIGANGVSLFFAISGFLICSRLLEEQSAFGRISLKGFYIRRACRILPAALAYLMFITVLAFLGYIAVDRREFWATLFFWRNYLADFAGRDGKAKSACGGPRLPGGRVALVGFPSSVDRNLTARRTVRRTDRCPAGWSSPRLRGRVVAR